MISRHRHLDVGIPIEVPGDSGMSSCINIFTSVPRHRYLINGIVYFITNLHNLRLRSHKASKHAVRVSYWDNIGIRRDFIGIYKDI